MSGWKRKLAGFGVVLFMGIAIYGMWGWFFGKTVRGVDLLAIFAGGFFAGVCFVKFVQLPRATLSASTPPCPPPGSSTPPVPKSGS